MTRRRVPSRRVGESWTAYVARLEVALGAGYLAWVASDAGQYALAAAAREQRAARLGRLRRTA